MNAFCTYSCSFQVFHYDFTSACMCFVGIVFTILTTFVSLFNSIIIMKRQSALTFFVILCILFMQCSIPIASSEQCASLFNEKNVHVYPVHVLSDSSDFDSTMARNIAAYINSTKHFTASVAKINPSASGLWFNNEAKMLKRSNSAFTSFLKAYSGDQYGLLVEFLMQPRGPVAVHIILVDNRESKPVYVRLINSHNPVFARMAPKTKDDCLALFKEVFGHDMQELHEKFKPQTEVVK